MKKDMQLLAPLFYGNLLFVVVALILSLFSLNSYLTIALAVTAAANLLYTGFMGMRFRNRGKRYLEFLSFSLNPSERETLEKYPLPTVSVDSENKILWYNDFFENDILNGKDVVGLPITNLFPGVEPVKALNPKGMEISYKGEHYSVVGLQGNMKGQVITTLLLKENTTLKRQATLYEQTKPSIMQVLVDNFDESLVLAKEREKNQILSDIELKIEETVTSLGGIVNKVEKDRFVAILPQSSMDKLIKGKFQILEIIKNFKFEVNAPVTLSIGVGYGGEDLNECNTFANLALDMSMGRGGDQATVKTPDGYEFFGESLQSTNRRTKVKSRLMAGALTEMIHDSDRVLIMGHKFADFDSVASALGIWRIAKVLGRKAGIVLDLEKNVSGPLVELALESKQADMFLSPIDAADLITKNTLLVVVDTHVNGLVQSKEVLDKSQNIFIIDHHRKVVDHIEKATVSYHEPSASSASEMVTEIAQYVALKYKNLDTLTANALLAGMMLDTKNFTIKTNVRTFEAAAYLKRCGADSAVVKKMFASSQGVFKAKAKLMAEAIIENGCAIASYVVTDDDTRLAGPSAADELLQVQGVKASFIVYKTKDCVNISARSLGEVNVQVILEKMGGGGHLTMAGCQLKDKTVEQVTKELQQTIADYFKK